MNRQKPRGNLPHYEWKFVCGATRWTSPYRNHFRRGYTLSLYRIAGPPGPGRQHFWCSVTYHGTEVEQRLALPQSLLGFLARDVCISDDLSQIASWLQGYRPYLDLLSFNHQTYAKTVPKLYAELQAAFARAAQALLSEAHAKLGGQTA